MPTFRSSASRSRRRRGRLADTDRALRHVEEELARRPEVKHWFANLGRGNPRVYYTHLPAETNANVAEVFAELEPSIRAAVPCSTRSCGEVRRVPRCADHGRILPERTADRRTDRSRDRRAGSRAAAPLAARAETLIEAVPGTRDVDNPVRRPAHRPRPHIDSQKAALLGVAPVRSGPDGARCGRGTERRQVREPTATSTTSRCGCRCRAADARRAWHDRGASASGRSVPLRSRDPQSRPAASLCGGTTGA